MSAFVIILVLVNILACLWLIVWTAKRRAGEEAEGTEKKHVWDDDLRELNNPMPRWWLNLFVLTIVFSFAYLVLYPGLLGFSGTLGWSQEKQHDERLAEIQARREAHLEQFAGQDIPGLAANLEAAQAGAQLFARHCAGCHGADAQGAIGFPNLADQDWLYGSAPEAIRTSIVQGRRGMMPGFHATLEPAMATDLVTLVRSWNKPALPQARLSEVQRQFQITCAACHGGEGQGNPMLGAPNLSDDTWLYGGDAEAVRHSILFGRQGNMPAHADLLSEIEIELLTAYVYRLSGQAD